MKVLYINDFIPTLANGTAKIFLTAGTSYKPYFFSDLTSVVVKIDLSDGKLHYLSNLIVKKFLTAA